MSVGTGDAVGSEVGVGAAVGGGVTAANKCGWLFTHPDRGNIHSAADAQSTAMPTGILMCHNHLCIFVGVVLLDVLIFSIVKLFKSRIV